mgnify:CR=1 FL=1|jgi:hypothetical protein
MKAINNKVSQMRISGNIIRKSANINVYQKEGQLAAKDQKLAVSLDSAKKSMDLPTVSKSLKVLYVIRQ